MEYQINQVILYLWYHRNSTLFGDYIEKEIKNQGVLCIKTILGSSLTQIVQKEFSQLHMIENDVWNFIKEDIGINEDIINYAKKYRRNYFASKGSLYNFNEHVV